MVELKESPCQAPRHRLVLSATPTLNPGLTSTTPLTNVNILRLTAPVHQQAIRKKLKLSARPSLDQRARAVITMTSSTLAQSKPSSGIPKGQRVSPVCS